MFDVASCNVGCLRHCQWGSAFKLQTGPYYYDAVDGDVADDVLITDPLEFPASNITSHSGTSVTPLDQHRSARLQRLNPSTISLLSGDSEITVHNIFDS